MANNPNLLISSGLWHRLLTDLHQRTEECHESGAFMLGNKDGHGRRVEHVVYYDELDPNAYQSGVVVMHAASFGLLWDLCRTRKLSVVADVHVHPEGAWQSYADRDNPMIAQRGHLALIVPDYARPPVHLNTLGFFEYLGGHRWRNLGGRHISHFFHFVN